MTLKCTADGRIESQGHPVSVCHHCGRPVCEQHGWVVSADDAFDDSPEESGRRMPQPAMHCKQCVDAHHLRAYKHPGWTDPKEVQPQWQQGQQMGRATGRP
jgi:hypothetical protein